MKTLRTIEFDSAGLDQLLSNLQGYWLVAVQQRDMNREELYRMGLLKPFYERLRSRHDRMVINGRKVINVKFDAVHAVLMVDVLQRTMATKTTLDILYQLGSICPPQMQKV